MCFHPTYNHEKNIGAMEFFHNTIKNWFGGACWEIVDCMCEHVLKIIQSVVVGDRFVFLKCK
jgi:hypothetical protein